MFLTAIPGLEAALDREARRIGLRDVTRVAGGVLCQGDLAEAAEANMRLRTAVRVLWRIAEFRAMHLAQLDKRARKVAWRDMLRPDVPVRVEAMCRRSRIYVNKAAVQRIAGAIEAAGVAVTADAEVVVKARIDDDLCTISIDTTGEALHRRGHKTFVGKAPLRETMAAAFLDEMGFDGTQTVVDPMCGSGTFVLEAAEIAARLLPGRSRRFAFEQLAGQGGTSGPSGVDRLCPNNKDGEDGPVFQGFGYDRNDGAIRGARENAARAGVETLCRFERQAVSDLTPPDGAPGLVMVNPPYGGRIGDRKMLFGLYGALGEVLRERFGGWRLGLVTSDGGLAKATGLDLDPFGPVDHSGTKVHLYKARL